MNIIQSIKNFFNPPKPYCPLTANEIEDLSKLFSRIVTQGPYHNDNISKVLALLKSAVKCEFTEDNEATLTAFLNDCWNTADKYTTRFSKYFNRD